MGRLTLSDWDLITSTWLYPRSNAICLKDLHSMLLKSAIIIVPRVKEHMTIKKGRSIAGFHLTLPTLLAVSHARSSGDVQPLITGHAVGWLTEGWLPHFVHASWPLALLLLLLLLVLPLGRAAAPQIPPLRSHLEALAKTTFSTQPQPASARQTLAQQRKSKKRRRPPVGICDDAAPPPE